MEEKKEKNGERRESEKEKGEKERQREEATAWPEFTLQGVVMAKKERGVRTASASERTNKRASECV